MSVVCRMYSRDVAEPGPSGLPSPRQCVDSDSSGAEDELGTRDEHEDGALEGEARKSGMKQVWDSIRISVFVLGSALIVFIAATNSLTWSVTASDISHALVICSVQSLSHLVSYEVLSTMFGQTC